jgi:hypothetical protein
VAATSRMRLERSMIAPPEVGVAPVDGVQIQIVNSPRARLAHRPSP